MTDLSTIEPVGVRRLADLLLPGTDRLPSASQVPDFDRWFARALAASRDMSTAVVDFAARAAEAPDLSIAVIESWGAAEAEQVVFVISCAYYMSPAVRDALGYPGQARRPIADALPTEIADEELLRPVIDRGAAYVSPPD